MTWRLTYAEIYNELHIQVNIYIKTQLMCQQKVIAGR